MSLFKRLLARAGLMKLEVAETAASAGQVDPAARTRPIVSRRSVTLAELLDEARVERAEREEALQAAASGLTADVDQVYAAAGVADPPHGWTIDRVVAFAAERADRGRAEQRRALQAQLAIERVPAEDLFHDARERDEAVDAYERFLRAKVAELREDFGLEEARLERELAELRSQLASLAERRAALESTWSGWRRAKRARERSWAAALRLLLARDQPVDDWVSADEDEPS